MENYQRYAVYYAPRAGAFADRSRGWLAGTAKVPGLDLGQRDITSDPRRYGFHGTLRAPFRPGDGVDAGAIALHVGALATTLKPVRCDSLELVDLEGFLALVPTGAPAALLEFAARVVEATDVLRAPLTEAEIARRHPESLTPRQRALLQVWGYPFVMEEFRFHLTLTNRLLEPDIAPTRAALAAYFTPVLPVPFEIEDLCLFGEDAGGRFHLLDRYALTG
ncbi:MAG: phosphonate metabolism protein [Rhodobacterales bacterium 12-65-15]|nr:MAG: phosphonate metabolism protein [Rhodobacterales bacterium 12-65-15]